MERVAGADRLSLLLGSGIALVLLGAVFYVWDVGYTKKVAKSCMEARWPCTAVDWSPLGLILVAVGSAVTAYMAVRLFRRYRSRHGRRTTPD
jgi:hypothetical protein